MKEGEATEEDANNEDGIRFPILESRFKNKETVLNCPRRVFGPEAKFKTRGGTLGSHACIHTRNFKKVRNVLVVWEVFSI